MKIVHVCLIGTVTDGFTYQDNLLPKYHAMMGHDVVIIAAEWIRNNSGGFAKDTRQTYINEHGITVIRLPLKGQDNFMKKFLRYRGLKERLEEINPDIAFIHGVQFLDIKTIFQYAQKKQVILYIDNHADFTNSAKSLLSKLVLHKIIWRYYAKKINPYVKKFYGVMPSRLNFLLDVYHLPNEKCELLLMGADDDFVNRASQEENITITRRNHKIESSEFLIVTGGKIDNWKAQTLLLIQAIKRLNRKNVKLIIFGSIVPGLKEQIIELCDDTQIQYIGWQNDEDSYHLFGASDLVVFPGRHSVYWEQAAGQGIPMVVRRWNGTEHIDVGGNVVFLEKDSEEEIFEKLSQILDNDNLYYHMNKIAKKKGIPLFSYRNIAEQAIR